MAFYQNNSMSSEKTDRPSMHAIIDFTEGTTKAVEEGKYSAGVFLDLLKACDIINHRTLW